MTRAYPVGPQVTPNGVHFRVWAPKRSAVEVIVTDGPGAGAVMALDREADGYFSGSVARAKAGSRYRFRLDAAPGAGFPDPASRFQPDGPHGDSEVVASEFPWSDQEWTGPALKGQVIYEMHIGTFTPAGTWEMASAELEELKSAGITLLEIMPVADFAGRFGWGYDGVNLFAPTRLYGTPHQFRAFIDRAHGLGLGVILDVVYNHLGPDGNYLREFSDDYFSTKYKTDWGEAINFDGPNCDPVRQFYHANAAYWIREFHLDGLRLDATQNIYDDTRPHILKEIRAAVKEAAGARRTIVVAENEPQDTGLIRTAGIDALWNDDFHHSAMVALTGKSEAYYSDHRGAAQEFISSAKHGFLFQGQWYSWQKQPRGTPALDLPPEVFISFIQNHDQIANTAGGERIHDLATHGGLRAMTTLLLLMPSTPMLFQGQEFGATARFLYFSDLPPEIGEVVAKGRIEFLSQFPSLVTPQAQARLSDPRDPMTFEECKLDFGDRERNRELYDMHKALLRLRRSDPVFASQSRNLDGAVLGLHTFLLRFFDHEHGDRMLLVNLDSDLHLTSVPEPLLAPPAGRCWKVLFHSDDPAYGGPGVYRPDAEDGWRLSGRSAVALAAG